VSIPERGKMGIGKDRKKKGFYLIKLFTISLVEQN
jgi:hypothetical protein